MHVKPFIVLYCIVSYYIYIIYIQWVRIDDWQYQKLDVGIPVIAEFI